MIEVIMPKLGLTMEEGTIVRWLKSEGDEIAEGEPLLEVETDKVQMDVEAPASGTLGKILVCEGEKVPVVQVIAYILQPGEVAPEDWPDTVPIRQPEAPAPAVEREKVSVTPAARRMARERGIDLAQIEGTGEDGVITTEDILRSSEERASEVVPGPAPVRVSPRARRLASEKGVSLSEIEGSGPEGRITSQDVLDFLGRQPLVTPSTLQRITAERMTGSFTTTPHFYLTLEADASQLVQRREQLIGTFEEEVHVRLTFTDMLIFLVARALEGHPLANSSWEDGRIRIYEDINIGVATAVDEGLIVPVVGNANHKSLAEIAQERSALAEKAAKAKLTLQELEGGTFTLTNLGMFGVDEFGAIINPPQSSILAVGRIAERAIVIDGNVEAKPSIRFTLTVDHRVLGGTEGARFLNDLKAAVEDASELLCEPAG
jgi:pyruvate dehydrogenase E2 component (dihydrolipoamide acetyltransferase)